MSDTMRAVVLEAPGPPEALRVRELPDPQPPPGLGADQGHGVRPEPLRASHPARPRRGRDLPARARHRSDRRRRRGTGRRVRTGQQVAAMMGRMGRTFDGGYAEYTCVPAAQVIPFHSELDWATLGAVPEMLQTAYGSLTIGLDAQPGQTLLIRGGTSSIGMATAVLAKDRGLTVLSTTRRAERAEALTGDRCRPRDRRRRRRRRRRARRSCPKASTSRSNWSAPLRFRTRCARPGSTEWSASPGCCPTSGPSATSTRSTTSPAACDSPPTAATPPTCPPTCSRTFLDDVAAGRSDGSAPPHLQRTRPSIPTAHADMEAGQRHRQARRPPMTGPAPIDEAKRMQPRTR